MLKYFTSISTDINYMGKIVLFSAYYLGIKFPDWDFKFKLKHRNILTHSPLALFFILYLYLKNPQEIYRFFIAGFSLGLGLHFIFDLFPKGWGGGALLHLPIKGKNLGAPLSKGLFILFSIISLIISILFTIIERELLFIFTLGILTLIKNIAKEKKIFRPAAVYIVVFSVFSALKYDTIYVMLLNNYQRFLDIIIHYLYN